MVWQKNRVKNDDTRMGGGTQFCQVTCMFLRLRCLRCCVNQGTAYDAETSFSVFFYTNKGQLDLHLYRKNRLKLVPKPWIFSQKISSAPKIMAWGEQVTPLFKKCCHIWELAKLGAPPLLVPSFLTWIFGHATSPKKVVFFWRQKILLCANNIFVRWNGLYRFWKIC